MKKVKKILILFWFYVLIGKDEFNAKLDNLLFFRVDWKTIGVRREVAHLLSNPLLRYDDIPDFLIDRFKIKMFDFLPQFVLVYLDTVFFVLVNKINKTDKG